MTARVKREDLVLVLRGKDKGKRGKVQRVFTTEHQVLVEGINLAKRHLKAGAQGARQAGIVSKEMPMDISKVMPVCATCGKPTRVRITTLEDGTKTRVCKQCNAMMS